jgi:hypothetical protein
MLEMGEPEIGALYCYIDPAKTMAADLTKKLIHTKNMILGDDECEFETIDSSEKDRKNFKTGCDWSEVDPVLCDRIEKIRKKPN